MRIAIVCVAGILMMLVGIKLLVPLVLLIKGYGVEAPLPAGLVRALPPRVVTLLMFTLGPLLMGAIAAAAWLLLRRMTVH